MRVLITGNSGAGKTTLAKQVVKEFDLPLIHLDAIFWQENWQRPDMQWWREEVQKLVDQDRWVIEGNYANTFGIRFPRATTLIHLDFSRWFCLLSCLRRRYKVGATNREELAPGCNEQVEWNFYKYIWDYPSKFSPKVYEMAETHFKGEFIPLKTRVELSELDFSLLK